MQKPRNVPRDFFQFSIANSLALILYACILYVLPATLAVFVLHSEFALAWQVILLVPLCLIASFGLGLFLWLGHEGGHGLLHPNYFVSNALGILASFPVAPQSAIGFSASHLEHHRLTNREGDPNLEIYRPFTGFWERMLKSPGCATRKYSHTMSKMLRYEDLPFRFSLPLNKDQLRRLALLNRIVQIAWLGTLLGGLVFFTLETLIVYLIPGFISRSYNGIRPYMEHAGLGTENGQESRIRSSWLWTVLEAGNNYHQEHHLYPRVPCYKLPALHRYLQQQNFYDRAENIEPGFLGAFLHASRTTRLPGQ